MNKEVEIPTQEIPEKTSRIKSKFKVWLSPSKKIVFRYFNKSPLKLMKNVFRFMLKALFVKIFTFLL